MKKLYLKPPKEIELQPIEVEDSKPYFVPIPDTDLPKQESIEVHENFKSSSCRRRVSRASDFKLRKSSDYQEYEKPKKEEPKEEKVYVGKRLLYFPEKSRKAIRRQLDRNSGNRNYGSRQLAI